MGILLWLLRAFQMGGIVNLLSHPVISGFINAAAVVIIVSQLAAFTGVVPAGGGSAVEQATRLWQALPDADLKAVGIGFASLVVIWIVRHYGRFVGSWVGDSPHPPRGARWRVVLLATLCVAVIWNRRRRQWGMCRRACQRWRCRRWNSPCGGTLRPTLRSLLSWRMWRAIRWARRWRPGRQRRNQQQSGADRASGQRTSGLRSRVPIRSRGAFRGLASTSPLVRGRR